MAQNNAASDVIGTFAHMKKNGTLKILIIALVTGIVLFLVGSLVIPNEKDSSSSASPEPEQTKIIGFFEYKELLEKEIEQLCQSVSGVESASAIVFFDDVGSSIYAQNIQSGASDSQKIEYVIIGSGSNSHALYLGESLPSLSGIGIVCNTGGNVSKRNELVALIAAAYGLPMTRIYVSEG